MKTVFVTGGAGFIGSAFVRMTLESMPNTRIVNFDALTYAGNMENLDGVPDDRHHFVRGDITNREEVLAALDEDVDAVVHFAAESHVDRSILSADAFLRTNVLGTQVLLDAARARSVKRFLLVSTDEVLGSLSEDDPQRLFREADAYEPNSPYAASKAAAEHLVRAATHTFGLNTLITRCGNNYGPRQFPEKLIPLVIANAIDGAAIPVYGDGRNSRDWIYVDDHCRALLAVLRSGTAGGIYHVGARNERHNLDVIRSILKALGKPESLIRFVKDRLGHDRRYAIDPWKIQHELGWRPRETWESGLEKTVQWYLDNPTWIENVRSGAYRTYYARQYEGQLEPAHA